MIKNIPNKYNNALLKDKINNLFHDSYDFFYLPMDFQVIYFIFSINAIWVMRL